MISYLGKFDLPCLMTYFASYKEKTGIKINILKKAASYFTVELIKDEKLPTEKRMSFRDVRSYCPPCNLDTFLTSWEAPFSKSIFPFQRYGSVEELAQATDFPTKEDFFNSLKQVFQNISMAVFSLFIQKDINDEIYDEAKTEYERRKALPDSDPEKMRSMLDWLKYYQLLDTGPLVQALDNYFAKLYELFNIDSHLNLSLPKISFT